MSYAKLENGVIYRAPNRIKISNMWVYNPTDAQLLTEGYLPVVETPMPETDEQHFATPHWAIENNQIVQSWTVVEIPYDDTPDKAEAYDILMGEVDS